MCFNALASVYLFTEGAAAELPGSTQADPLLGIGMGEVIVPATLIDHHLCSVFGRSDGRLELGVV